METTNMPDINENEFQGKQNADLSFEEGTRLVTNFQEQTSDSTLKLKSSKVVHIKHSNGRPKARVWH
jgi:hypothetical protein